MDPIHSVNMLNVCAYLQSNEQLKLILEQEDMIYLSDSNGKYPSDYIIGLNNVRGITFLF